MPQSKAESLEIQFRNRALIIELVKALPPWIWGALFWWFFVEIIVKQIAPAKVNDIHKAVTAVDVIAEMPPGVALVSEIYTAIGVIEKGGDILSILTEIALKINDALGPFKLTQKDLGL